jgi:polysaccharide export outer membrane protein
VKAAILLCLILWVTSAELRAQAVAAPPPISPDPIAAGPTGEGDSAPQVPMPPVERPLASAEYRIGPDDVLSIAVLQAPELNTSVRVSQQGDVSLPLLGTVRATGMTTQELESRIETRLREKYVRDPDVTVMATEIRSQGVSVVGAVRRPGVVQIRGTTSLLEALSLAGGLADDAGDTVIILRKSHASATAIQEAKSNVLPQQSVPDLSGAEHQTSVALELKLKSVMESSDPAVNVLVQPGDVVNVHAASVLYVIGAVNTPGSFAMRGNVRLTVLRALALGEGLTPTAARTDAVVLRTNGGGQRSEVPVDLEAVLKGNTPDIVLESQDVLFVPSSGSKVAARATLDFLARAISLRGLIPYRR